MMVRAQSLVRRYGAVIAVNELSFEVATGETLALIGPNGAGKTTTLRMLLGLTRPDSGSITIGPRGLAPHDPDARRELGYVPQRVEFPHGRTVREVLAFYAALRGLPAAAVGRALERVSLTSYAGRRATELSGGYTQRLSLAQALLADPMLLVLDEPTASLDPEATWEFRSLIQQLQAEGKTILLCSHLLSEIERIAHRVLILLEGRCVGLESLSELRARQAQATRLAIHLGEAPARAVAALEARAFACELHGDGVVVEATNGRTVEALDTLRAAQIRVTSFEMLRPSLEEIFLAAVQGGRSRA